MSGGRRCCERLGQVGCSGSEIANSKEATRDAVAEIEGLHVFPVASEGAESRLCLTGELEFATVAHVRARLREFEGRPLVLD